MKYTQTLMIMLVSLLPAQTPEPPEQTRNAETSVVERESSDGTSSLDGPAIDKSRGKREANSDGPSLEGSYSYQLGAGTVAIRAERVINRSATRTTGTLQLELWATQSEYRGGSITGYTVGQYRFGSVLRPGYYYSNVNQTVAMKEPPRGTYAMVLLLTEYQDGRFVIVDYGNFSRREEFGGGATGGADGLEIEGRVEYQTSGSSVRLKADKVSNNSYTRTSGSLQVSLWATTSKYTGGTINGYRMATYQFGDPLKPRQYYELNREVAFTAPPRGDYFVTMTLSEWNNGNWLIVHHRGFDDMMRIGGGSTTSQLELVGPAKWTWGGGRVRMEIARINNKASGGTSGSLRVELWATRDVYQGGAITGYVQARRDLSPLAGGRSYVDLTLDADYVDPPAGTWRQTLLLTEWNGSEFVIRDSVNGITAITVGSATREPAQLTAPAAGARLVGSCVDLAWSPGSGGAGYYIELGTRPDSVDLFDGWVGSRQDARVCGLPGGNRTLYLRLWTLFPGDDWQVRSYQFTSAGGGPRSKAEMAGPPEGATIAGGCATFAWTAGSGVDDYYLEVGTSPARAEYFDRGVGRVLSQRVCGLPTNGTGLLARIWSRFGDDWEVSVASYRTAR